MNEAQYRFWTILKDQLEYLFKNDPRYARTAEMNLPGDFAGKIMRGLTEGTADKEGTAVKNTCRALGIKCTYKAINEYLKG